jgi:hypothetical protein
MGFEVSQKNSDYLQTDEILQKALRIVANEIKKKVISCSPKITNPEFGAVSVQVPNYGTDTTTEKAFASKDGSSIVMSGGMYNTAN